MDTTGRERALLVECLLAAAGPRPGLAARAAAVEPARLGALARRWAVAETCAHALLAAGAEGPLDAGGLREDAENAAAKNTLLLADAVTLQQALAREGITSVALKGAALVAAHYPAVGARHVGDLDLLVSPAEVARAAEVLRALGLPRALPELPALDGRALPPERLGRHHLAPFVTPGGIWAELHLALPGVAGRRADPDGVLARAVEAPWRGAGLRIPCLDDLLGVACAHALGAHAAEPLHVPRHVADVAVLLGAGADAARAARLHPGPEVAASLALLAAARAGDAAAVLGPGRPGRLAPLRRRARVTATVVAAARRGGELRRLLFPARAWLAARYGVAPGSRWIPLLWAWRPLRGALRLVTGR